MKTKLDILNELKRIEQIESLLPHRREVYETIVDHSPISFESLHRRFMGTNSSTLHYDLQQLLSANLIKKLGRTRGALYSASRPE